jgi:hypothetical protein
MLTRRTFLSATAVGASAIALGGRASAATSGGRAPIHFHVLRPSEYDGAAMQRILDGPAANKQVFLWASTTTIVPGVASLYLHMQNSLNAFAFSQPQDGGPGMAVAAVLLGPAIVFGLSDDMWRRYGFGAALKLDPVNTYYRASSSLDPAADPDDPNGMYQDWSAQAVQRRGGSFMLCHNAMTAVAGLFAQGMGKDPRAVLSDFERNTLPGFLVVPAGVAAVQAAQLKGWKLFPVG